MLTFKNFLAEAKLKSHTKASLTAEHPFENLSNEESASVQRYTMHSYDLNKGLYHKHNGIDSDFAADVDDSHLKNRIKNIDSAIAKNTLTKPLSVYSGVRNNPVEKASDTGHINMPAFTSATMSKPIARRFAHEHPYTANNRSDHHVLKINLHPGHKMLPVLDNTAHEKNEQEVILPRHTTLKVRGSEPIETHEKVHPKTGHKFLYHVWDTDVVHQGE